jgi:hypothetical protein
LVSINKRDAGDGKSKLTFLDNSEGDIMINPRLLNAESKLINTVGDALQIYQLNNKGWIHLKDN